MNVVNFESHKNRENNAAPNREEELVDAIWHGVQNSRWAKDPDDPNAEPSLGRYVAHVCDISPRTVLKMLMRFYEPPIKD